MIKHSVSKVYHSCKSKYHSLFMLAHRQNPPKMLGTMAIPSLEDLLLSACHFGHPRTKWNPKMAPYLYKVERGIHIFDLVQTREHLTKVCEELQDLLTNGKTILFVSTKQLSIPFIEHIAHTLHQPMVIKKWIAGLLTNWATVRKRLQYYLDLKKSFQTGEVEKYTKKEQVDLRKKLVKLETALGGVSSMTDLPHAIFVVDAVLDKVAVAEAKKIGIPVYGICDSNANPDFFKVCIPCNDDAIKSVELILKTVEEELKNAPKKEPKEIKKKPVEESIKEPTSTYKTY